MTVSANPPRRVAQGNGSGTVFGLNFEFGDEDTLTVTLVSSAGVGAVKTLDTHYTVAGGDGETGSVTMVTAPAVGETLVIERIEPETQTLDLLHGDPFNAATVEAAFDRLERQIQRNSDLISRSALRPSTATVGADSLTIPEPEASKILAGKSDLTGFENVDLDDLLGDASAIFLPVSVGNGGTGESNAAGLVKARYIIATGSSNAFTVAPSPAPAALAAGMSVTFTANHTIDGAATLTVTGTSDGEKAIKDADGNALINSSIVSGGVYTAIYDGTDWHLDHVIRTGALISNIEIFTANDTWTEPSLCAIVEVYVIGGGGSGGGTAASTPQRAAGGGGGGEGAYARIPASSISGSVSVTVGAGGAAPTAGENAGNNGSASSFGSFLTAGGGSGGAAGTNTTQNAGGAGGTGGTVGSIGTGESIHQRGEDGASGIRPTISASDYVTCFGDGGKAGGPFGGSGDRGSFSAGGAGQNYGGGGSGAAVTGSTSARAGGAGAAGVVIVKSWVWTTG